MSAFPESPQGGDVDPEAGAPASPVAMAPGDAPARLRHTIDLRHNPLALAATLLFGALVLTLLVGLWYGHFAKTETVRGLVATSGGFSKVDAPHDGIIDSIAVRQGDLVEAGQPLFTLRIGEVTAGGESSLAAQIRTMQQSRVNSVAEIDRDTTFIDQALAQKATMTHDVTSLQMAVDSEEKSISTAVVEADARVQRVKLLVQQGYATRDTLEGQERTAFDYKRQLTDIRLKRLQYGRADADRDRELNTAIADKQSQRTAAENEVQSVDGTLAKLRTEGALEVQAQRAGYVLALDAKVGDTVTTGQFVAAIGDGNADIIILVDAPARAIGLVRVGQSVVLKYDAFPFKTFGIQHGVVTAISEAAIRTPAGKDDKDLEPAPSQRQSLYRIEIKPDSKTIEAYGEKTPLKIGSTLSAEIIVERRRLIDWVLDPIRAMRGRG